MSGWTSRRGSREKITDMYGNLRLLAKLHPSNLVNIILTNCVKFNFGKNNLQCDSHTNTLISDRFAQGLLARMI